MKRKLYVSMMATFILTSANHLYAQISKGSNMVGGSIYYSNQKNDQTATNSTQTTKYSNFGITPAYGKAVRNNLVIGADINYGNNVNETVNSGNSSKIEGNSFGVGVFARPYKNLGTSGFYLFLQGRLGVDITKQEQGSISSSYTNKGFNIGAGINPGIAYAITSKMHIETGLNNLFYAGYSSSKSTNTQPPDYSYKSNGFSAGIGLGNSTTWTVGVKFFFGS